MRTRRRTLTSDDVPVVVHRFAAVVVGILVVAACASPVPSIPNVATASPITSPNETAPAETVLCEPYDGLLPSGIERDSCPPAIAAVRATVAPLDLPIARIVIEPGVFLCDDPWPRPGSSGACLGPSILAGTTMRGWVSFAGSAKVAAVRLDGSLGEPRINGTPSPTTAAILVWTASIAAFTVPPAGWTMP